MGYETRRAAEVELPKGTVRLGRKAADGSIVPIESRRKPDRRRHRRRVARVLRLLAGSESLSTLRFELAT